MSFSSKLKREIASQIYKTTCCRKAFINGVLCVKADLEGEHIHFNIENDELAAYTAKMIFDIFGKEPTVSKNSKGGRCRVVSFSSKSAAKYLSAIKNGEFLFSPKCPSCEAAFFRGIFFVCGRACNPEKQYLLEFSPINNYERVVSLLEAAGIYMRTAIRRGVPIVYVKKSSVIEDFFAFIGLNNAAFSLMNEKIKSEIRNNANRIVNCETNNIDKAVSASHRHLAILEQLERANLLTSLPDELEKTARLRLKHRALSLSQLSQLSIPPISKSGLSHRLNKIIELAAALGVKAEK